MDEQKGTLLPSICQKHWDMLREKINGAGLGKYIAQGGEMAATMLADQVEEGMSVGNWDPLMSSWFMITGNAMQMAGTAVFGAAQYDNCVICFLNAQRNEDGSCPCPDPRCPAKEPGSIENFEAWLDKAVEGQLDYARVKGLIK